MQAMIMGTKRPFFWRTLGLKFHLSSQTRRTKVIDQNWREYLARENKNPNRKPFMDVSSNKKSLKLSELEGKLRNSGLLEPFRSKKTVDFDLQEITEGKAKILVPENEEHFDPDAKFDLFSIYNIATVGDFVLKSN